MPGDRVVDTGNDSKLNTAATPSPQKKKRTVVFEESVYGEDIEEATDNSSKEKSDDGEVPDTFRQPSPKKSPKITSAQKKL